MCGLAGIHAYAEDAPPVDPDELRRINDHMVRRGPDGSGLWIDPSGTLGLAHRRLAIVDLSEGGAQPMHAGDSGHSIVFNGEIYNHRELRAQLERDGDRLVSCSDTEVLLRLFVRHGPAMLPMLRGMFAFAVWRAADRSLFLARDPFGIKPLYVADDGRTVRFASQVRALLQGRVDRAPDPAGHVGFMLWGSVPDPHTLYRGIRAVPAGHWLTVRSGRGVAAPTAFGDLLAPLRGERPPESRAALLDRASAAVADSVRAHMLADVPVGVFLSAGLDSTLLASQAADHGALRTLTVGFDGLPEGLDETALATRVAEQFGARHHVERVGREDFAADADAILAAMDQPTIDGINTWFVARTARRAGLKVALSGIGGDEVFGSYPSFTQVPRIRALMRPFRLVPTAGRLIRACSAPIVARRANPKVASLPEFGGTLSGAYLLRRALHLPWELPTLMDPDLARAGLATLQPLAALDRSAAGIHHAESVVSALELQWYMRHQLLRDADWAGMAHSIEIRVPFVDAPTLRAAAPLLRAAPRVRKVEVARAAAPTLPEAVLARRKTGFAVPMHAWVMGQRTPIRHPYRSWARRVYDHHTR